MCNLHVHLFIYLKLFPSCQVRIVRLYVSWPPPLSPPSPRQTSTTKNARKNVRPGASDTTNAT